MRISFRHFPIALYIEGVIWYELTCVCCGLPMPFFKFGKEAHIDGKLE
jgi:hypothetical protein